MNGKNQVHDSSPCAVLGAGDLVSHVHRIIEPTGIAEYQFNVFRFDAHMQATHQLRTCDLLDIVKLCQVVAFAILDDGWSSPEQQEQLVQLRSALEAVTESWSNEHGHQATT